MYKSPSPPELSSFNKEHGFEELENQKELFYKKNEYGKHNFQKPPKFKQESEEALKTFVVIVVKSSIEPETLDCVFHSYSKHSKTVIFPNFIAKIQKLRK